MPCTTGLFWMMLKRRKKRRQRGAERCSVFAFSAPAEVKSGRMQNGK